MRSLVYGHLSFLVRRTALPFLIRLYLFMLLQTLNRGTVLALNKIMELYQHQS